MSIENPTIIQSARGELGLFDEEPAADGTQRWAVGRPLPDGWQGVGRIAQTTAGYVASLDYPLAPEPTVPDAAAALAARADALDAEHGYPSPLREVPAALPDFLVRHRQRVREALACVLAA